MAEPKLPDWLTTQKIIEIYVGLRLSVCDDPVRIKKEVDKQAPRYLRDSQGGSVECAKAEQWFKEVHFLLRDRTRAAALERVYKSFCQNAVTNPNVTESWLQDMLDVGFVNFSLDATLVVPFIRRFLEGIGYHFPRLPSEN